jgi:pyruvate dehydrogenase E2 component (dihydrolipoamide acetyltransferase)
MALFEMMVPSLGEDVMDGQLDKWHVRLDEQVEEGQVVAEVGVGRGRTVTVTSPKAGRVLSMHGQEGERVRVHQLLVLLQQVEAVPARETGRYGSNMPSWATQFDPLPTDPDFK